MKGTYGRTIEGQCHLEPGSMTERVAGPKAIHLTPGICPQGGFSGGLRNSVEVLVLFLLQLIPLKVTTER